MAKEPKAPQDNYAIEMAKLFIEIQSSSFRAGVKEGRRQADIAKRLEQEKDKC